MAARDGSDAASRGHLRRLLLSLGVGQRGRGMSQRALAKASGYELSKDTWQRMTRPIPPGQIGPNWGRDVLEVAAATLRKLGAAVTVEQLDWAMMRDRGHIPGVSGDDLFARAMALIQSLDHDDLLRLNQEVALLLAPTRRTDQSPPLSAPMDSSRR